MATEMIDPSADGFRERVTPKEPSDVFFFACKSCGGKHFRHAGYMEVMLPFMRAGNEKRVGMDSVPVKVCVGCKAAFVWLNGQAYDVTSEIDLTAWTKTEKEAHRATGPGGQC
jgi:hypothetical protein